MLEKDTLFEFEPEDDIIEGYIEKHRISSKKKVQLLAPILEEHTNSECLRARELYKKVITKTYKVMKQAGIINNRTVGFRSTLFTASASSHTLVQFQK